MDRARPRSSPGLRVASAGSLAPCRTPHGRSSNGGVAESFNARPKRRENDGERRLQSDANHAICESDK